jgi:hypothetical protein
MIHSPRSCPARLVRKGKRAAGASTCSARLRGVFLFDEQVQISATSFRCSFQSFFLAVAVSVLAKPIGGPKKLRIRAYSCSLAYARQTACVPT